MGRKTMQLIVTVLLKYDVITFLIKQSNVNRTCHYVTIILDAEFTNVNFTTKTM